MRKLENVTIIAVDCKYYGQSANALLQCLKEVQPAKCLFLTDIDFTLDGVEVIKIEPIKSIQQYSNFIVKELYKYFNTSHCLVIQWDGYIINGDSWSDDFYDYDYIGAAWLYKDGRNCGNGGFSLRSQKLQSILGADNFIQIADPEDEVIGRLYRRYLEKNYDVRFPDNEICDQFSYELRTPVCKTFGFHGFFHPPFKEYICIKRTASLGDVVQVEPVLDYFYQKRFNVILDTLPQFFNLFIHHRFKIYHPQEIDPRIKYRVINLDMSYESKPKQLHLQSYFEFSGITDYVLRNPILNSSIEKIPANKLFKKYCILHIDDRPQAARNIQGDIDWEGIVYYLQGLDYTVIQIGRGLHKKINGAIQMNTPGEPFLMWVIKDADLFIGIDSGPSNIAVAFNIPCVLFFGSVEPKYIHADLSNIQVIQLENVCSNPKCWHSIIGTEGIECIELGKKKIKMIQGLDCEVEIKAPPCVQFKYDAVINAINKFI